MADPGSGGEAEGARFDLEKMKARFYELMEIDSASGMPTKEALENCGMA
jgi:aldehyde:ferredoxin oxidoreductase